MSSNLTASKSPGFGTSAKSMQTRRRIVADSALERVAEKTDMTRVSTTSSLTSYTTEENLASSISMAFNQQDANLSEPESDNREHVKVTRNEIFLFIYATYIRCICVIL